MNLLQARTFHATTFAFLLLAPTAAADFRIVCGAGRSKGPEQAEVAFLNETGQPMKIYVDGKRVPEERFGIKGLEGGRWLVGVDLGPGKGGLKFVFEQASSSVEKFLLPEAGGERRSGKARKCDWKSSPRRS